MRFVDKRGSGAVGAADEGVSVFSEIHPRKEGSLTSAKPRGRPKLPTEAKLMSLRSRFNELHEAGSKESCWPWKGRSGHYGMIGYGIATIYAHRASYLLHFGEIPDGLCVCHSCDNPLCVNPHHLWLGTQKENLEDMRRKGRDSRVGLALGRQYRWAGRKAA